MSADQSKPEFMPVTEIQAWDNQSTCYTFRDESTGDVVRLDLDPEIMMTLMHHFSRVCLERIAAGKRRNV